jgi:hypothetical protein
MASLREESFNPQFEEARRLLTALKWPRGLQETIIASCSSCPLRFFIIDDSGSMAASDGHQVVGEGPGKKY